MQVRKMFGMTPEQMRMIGKDNYFRRRTVSEVKEGREEVAAEKDLVERVRGLDQNTFLVIPHTARLIPEEFDTSRYFLKHAKEVWLPWKNRKALKSLKPIDLIREALAGVNGNYHVGLAFRSYLNGVITRLPFVAMLGGDKLFTYATQSPFTGIEIKSYSDTEAVQGHGGKYHVIVPSRRQNISRHRLRLEGVPIKGCDNHVRWSNIMTTHACPTKLWDLSYRHNQKNEWCEHEVAAYRQIARELAEEGDASALEYSPILQPTQETVDFNRKLEQQVLVEYEVKGQQVLECRDQDLEEDDRAVNVRRRLPNRAEREMFLYHLTKKDGLDSTWTPLSQELRQYYSTDSSA